MFVLWEPCAFGESIPESLGLSNFRALNGHLAASVVGLVFASSGRWWSKLLSLPHRDMSRFLVAGHVGAVTAGEVSAFNNTDPTPWIFRSLTDNLLKFCPVSLPSDSLLETDPIGLRRMSSHDECWVGRPQSDD